MKKIIFKSFLLLWTVLLACSCNDLLDEKYMISYRLSSWATVKVQLHNL